MSDGTEVKLILSEECDAILRAADLYADDSPSTAAVVAVRDEEGTFCFNVSRGIAAVDLRAILAYGRRERAEGERRGRADVQHQLRVLIGAAPLPE